MNIASPTRQDLAGIRARGHPWAPQIPNHFVDIIYVKLTNPSEAYCHGQLRPGSFNRITGQKNHLQVLKITDDLLNDLVAQSRITWLDVTRKERPFVHEQLPIIL